MKLEWENTNSSHYITISNNNGFLSLKPNNKSEELTDGQIEAFYEVTNPNKQNGGTTHYYASANLTHYVNDKGEIKKINISSKETVCALLKEIKVKEDKVNNQYTVLWSGNYELLDSNFSWKKLGNDLTSDKVLAIKKVISTTQTTFIFSKIAPLQKIIFGPPGTGKSYSIENIRNQLAVNPDGVVRTVFHPEYSYGDFVAKLLPVSIEKDRKKTVEYQIHAGPFIKALAKALVNPTLHYLLVIDEINRGNCAAIFGDIFQLLDRKDTGESEYQIECSKLTRLALVEEMKKNKLSIPTNLSIPSNLSIPANLSIVATMNTSDESVFFMDSAFKRRWQFEYLGPDKNIEGFDDQKDAKIIFESSDNTNDPLTWNDLRTGINTFIKENSAYVRRIEDKQLGLWFMKAKNNKISEDDIKYKLMFYLWDNVFARDKKPLEDLLNKKVENEKVKLVTFDDFCHHSNRFLNIFKPIQMDSQPKYEEYANPDANPDANPNANPNANPDTNPDTNPNANPDVNPDANQKKNNINFK
jgi:5-methylcytosine-specific restriction protein B